MYLIIISLFLYIFNNQMIKPIKIIDFFKKRNQKLIAKDWKRYKNSLILSGLMTSRIEKMMTYYKKGLITSKELYIIILSDINKHYTTMKN